MWQLGRPPDRERVCDVQERGDSWAGGGAFEHTLVQHEANPRRTLACDRLQGSVLSAVRGGGMQEGRLLQLLAPQTHL